MYLQELSAHLGNAFSPAFHQPGNLPAQPCSPRERESFDFTSKGLCSSLKGRRFVDLLARAAIAQGEAGAPQPSAARHPEQPRHPQRGLLATEPGPGPALHHDKRCGLAGLPRSQQPEPGGAALRGRTAAGG